MNRPPPRARGEEPLRILVLGASGGVGRWVCRLAAQRGWCGTALVRAGSDSEEVQGFALLRGDPLSRPFLAGVVPGHDAVVSCLGLRRSKAANPWSELRSPRDLTQRVAEHLVALMPPCNVNRLVAISAAGAGDSFAATSPPLRWLIRRSNLGPAYRDLEAMEGVLGDSGLDWMAIRPTTLLRRGPTGRVRNVARYRLTSCITRGDVAATMLDALASSSPFAARTPMLAGGRPWPPSRHAASPS